MTHVNTIKQNSTTYTYDQLQQMMANGSIDSSSVQNVSVFNASTDSSACTDGNDDGKIGFWEGLKSTVKGAVKGVVNGIKGMFTDEEGNFSLGKTLKTALTGAACFIPGVGPVIAAGLCAYGTVKGVTGVAQGISAAASATTDAEKRAAFESIGANGVTTVASAAGLKGSVGAIAKNAGFSSIGEVVTNAKNTGVISTAKQLGKGATNYYSSAWKTAGETLGKEAGVFQKAGYVAKEATVQTGKNVVNAYNTVKEHTTEKLNKVVKKKGNAATEGASAPKVETTYSKGADGKITQTKTETISIEEMPQETLNNLDSSYKIDWDNMTASRTTTTTGTKAQIGNTVNNIKNAANKFANSAVAEGYKGLPTSGNVKNAAFATTSSALTDSATEIENQIPYASTTYATVDTQTGHEYDLEDYSVMSQEEVDQKYADIINQTSYI